MLKKLVWEKRSLKKAYRLFLATTIIFSFLALLNLDNWLFRTLLQGSMILLTLFMGMDTVLRKKQKTLGYLLIGVSAFSFFVMINGIVMKLS
ncbi:hypothetical protein CEB3_c10110 [Peptococcaceae bacterium CEB3]|nr:hypothetical protein CEB3_c10110 [Peptococcaceae bacterium CEB3]